MDEQARVASRVEEALRGFLAAVAQVPDGYRTAADPQTGEIWDLAHVVGHVAEMLEFWSAELCKVAARGEGTPFGRRKTSPERIARIEASSGLSLDALLADIERRGDMLADLVQAIDPDRLQVHGLHPTLGPMTPIQIVEEFGVAHLEEHARQLSGDDVG